jgi:hypothetical protein
MHIDPALPVVAVFGANDPSDDELFAARLLEPPSTPVVPCCSPAATDPIPAP